MNNVYKQLEAIIYNGIKKTPLPFKKGNSIRIGKIVIRESKTQGYIIFDCENGLQIDVASSLRGAIAMSKLYLMNQDITKIKYLDRKYSKYYNDSIFYKASLKNASNESRKIVIEDRLDIAEDEMYSISQSLESIIFDNKR
jgi:hypothetical protein